MRLRCGRVKKNLFKTEKKRSFPGDSSAGSENGEVKVPPHHRKAELLPKGKPTKDGSGFETYATDSPSGRAIKKSEVNLWFTC